MLNKKILFFVLFLSVIAALHGSGFLDGATLEEIKQNHDALVMYAEANPLRAGVAFVLLYMAACLLMLPVAALLSIGAGVMFGVPLGVFLVMVAATSGACISFLASRHLFGNYLQNRYRARLYRFNHEFRARGIFYLMTLRFIPVCPFFLINILSGLTQIPLRVFMWTTCIGVLPGAFVFVCAGSSLLQIGGIQDVMTLPVLLAFIALATLSLSPVLYARLRGKNPAC